MKREDFAEIDAATRFLSDLPLKGETEYTTEEREPVRKWVAARIKHERSIGHGTDAYQREWFFFLHSLASKLGRDSLVTYGLIRWAIKTNNFYGRIYGDAWTQGHIQGSRYTYKRERLSRDKAVDKAVEKVIDNAVYVAKSTAVKINAAAGGQAKQRRNQPAKEFILAEWAAHRDDYDNNKSEFARVYARLVLIDLGVKITEKTIRESWLHTPSTGKRAR